MLIIVNVIALTCNQYIINYFFIFNWIIILVKKKIVIFVILTRIYNKIQDKVKRVLDIWISKDGGIYSKEILQNIKETHFQQRTTTDDARSLNGPMNGSDRHIGSASCNVSYKL